MGLTMKLWLLLALVYIGSFIELVHSDGVEGKPFSKTFTVSSAKEVEEVMQKIFEESGVCQNVPEDSQTTSSPMTSKSEASSTVSRKNAKGETPSINSESQICRKACSNETQKYSDDLNSWIGEAATVKNKKGKDFKIFCGCTCNKTVGANKPCPGVIQDCSYVVVQRRVNESLSFQKDYGKYKDGFGDMFANYWIGLNILHYLTSAYPDSRLAIVYHVNGSKQIESAWKVRIGKETNRYQLTFQETSTQFWKELNKTKFLLSGGHENCDHVGSGWWKKEGSEVGCNPNSLYKKGKGIWMEHPRSSTHVKFIEIRLYLNQKEDSCPSNR